MLRLGVTPKRSADSALPSSAAPSEGFPRRQPVPIAGAAPLLPFVPHPTPDLSAGTTGGVHSATTPSTSDDAIGPTTAASPPPVARSRVAGSTKPSSTRHHEGSSPKGLASVSARSASRPRGCPPATGRVSAGVRRAIEPGSNPSFDGSGRGTSDRRTDRPPRARSTGAEATCQRPLRDETRRSRCGRPWPAPPLARPRRPMFRGGAARSRSRQRPSACCFPRRTQTEPSRGRPGHRPTPGCFSTDESVVSQRVATRRDSFLPWVLVPFEAPSSTAARQGYCRVIPRGFGNEIRRSRSAPGASVR